MKKYTKYTKNTLLAFASTFPITAFAALDGVKGLLTAFGGLLKPIIPILLGLSLIYFFWGIGQFILHAGDQKTREEGKQRIIWGVIALFVFISIYGIILFIAKVFGITPGGSIMDGVVP